MTRPPVSLPIGAAQGREGPDCRVGSSLGTRVQSPRKSPPSVRVGASILQRGLIAKSQDTMSDFTFTFMHWRRKLQHISVFLPGESQGWGSLVGCRLWGHTESDTTEAT